MDSTTLSSILSVLRSAGVKSASVPTERGALRVTFGEINEGTDKTFDEQLAEEQSRNRARLGPQGPEDITFNH